MNSNIEDESGMNPAERMDSFLRICVRQIAQLADSDQFLDWVGVYGEHLLPEMAAQIDSQAGTPAQFFRTLGREIWAATPLPHKRFARERLPTPGRNDACYCGSGRKFKQCCGRLNSAEMGIQQMELLPYLLDVLPKKRWAELPGSAVSIDAIAATAFALLDDDCPDDAVKLLTPWFAGEGKWPDRLADLFDLLLDAYEALDKRKKRKDLAIAATARGEPQVAAIGWQRLAAMLADEGKLHEAWTAFGHAQRADPDNVSLAMLEITILISQQKWEQVSQRARFWATRIARMPGPKEEQLLDYLNRMASDPQQAMQEISGGMVPAFGQLTAMLAAAPAVACAYRLQPQDGLTGPLEPTPELEAAREEWNEAFPSAPPFSVQMTTYNAEAWDSAGQWLAVLASHPVLWQDFAVLDDLVCAIDGLNTLGLEIAIHALTGRALALLDCVLEDQHAKGQQLEWGFLENRPALRLVVRHILDCRAKGNEALVLPWLERMVNQLNPNDNHGLRDLLTQDYLQQGDFAQAVALGDRYPDDVGPMRYNRALAYYRAGRLAEADDALSDALNRYPLIGKVLLAKRAAKPKEGPITLGSRDEANRYRAEHLPLWPADALAWLAAAQKR
jgi:tetratricopeptide (TPR) repeat protein